MLEQLQNPHPFHLSSPSMDKQLSELFGVGLRGTTASAIFNGDAVSK